MRRLAVIALVISCLAISFGSVAQASPTTDKSGAFSIEVAANWTVGDPGEDLISVQGPNSIAQWGVTKESADGVNLDQFEKAFIAQAKKAMPKFKLISHARTNVNGSATGVWVYTAVFNKTTLKFKNLVTFKNNIMYNIIFATLPTRFSSDVSGCDSMVKSWKWL